MVFSYLGHRHEKVTKLALISTIILIYLKRYSSLKFWVTLLLALSLYDFSLVAYIFRSLHCLLGTASYLTYTHDSDISVFIQLIDNISSFRGRESFGEEVN